ncbi:MAG: Rieske (2Fe-2S) protein [Cytophagales bacterium]|nr:Rieske (2Fe-2S) protein [Cytophagales bacterium]
MERNDFIRLLGTGTLAVCAGCALDSCSSSDPSPSTAAPTNIDFTLDLTAAENAALQSVGGSLVKSGVIVARLSSTEFTALSRSCTHQGTPVDYQSGPMNFLCPNHGSRFATTGSVINGPAVSPLKKYNTLLTGDSLRVFS